MKKVVLLRHGESTWNRENRFTGWTDVDLSEKGVAEAEKAGLLLREEGFLFGHAYTSYLKRAVKTLGVVLDKLDQDWVPVSKSWRLNEKHYGSLQGLNKKETAEKYGDEQVHIWRRSYDVAPAPLGEEDPRNPRFDPRYRDVPEAELPRTESLLDTVGRIMPYCKCDRKMQTPAGARPPRLPAGRGPRQQPARHHQTPERHLRRSDFGVQSPDRRALCLRIRRRAELRQGLFPRRSRRDRCADGRRRRSGSEIARREFRRGKVEFPAVPDSRPSCFSPRSLRAGAFRRRG